MSDLRCGACGQFVPYTHEHDCPMADTWTPSNWMNLVPDWVLEKVGLTADDRP